MTRSKPVNRTAFCCLFLTTALILTACSSGGGGVAADIGTGLADALTAPLDHKDKGLKSLTLEDSIPQNGTLTLSAQGAEKTFKAGDKDNSLNTGKLKNDKISRFDFVQKIEVDGQTITLASGEFQIYKQNHSAVVALQIEKINNPDKIDSLINQRSFLVSGLGGEHTAFNQLPVGKAEYHGKAFSSDDAGGKLTYTIDFAAKQGHGKIEHLKSPELNVELATAYIKPDEKHHAVISGSVLYNQDEKGSYSLGIFGGQAQEVAGSAEVKTVNGIRHIGLAAKQ
ncbi:TPA: factor H-binding protein [Neisseria meningitidis]